MEDKALKSQKMPTFIYFTVAVVDKCMKIEILDFEFGIFSETLGHVMTRTKRHFCLAKFSVSVAFGGLERQTIILDPYI